MAVTNYTVRRGLLLGRVACMYGVQRCGLLLRISVIYVSVLDDSVAEWLAGWTQPQYRPVFKSQSLRCRVTVLGKLFTPIMPLFTKQRNW